MSVTSATSPIVYTISNVAAGPSSGALTINSVVLGGTNPGDFALSALPSLPVVLNPGQSFMFSGSFTPLAQGLRNADIVINSNTGGMPLSNTSYAISGNGTPGLFAATPTFPTQIDHGGPVIVQVVISSVANTVAEVVVEFTGGTQSGFAPAIIARSNLGTISGNVIQGLNVTPAGITLEIYWDAYASERHTTASDYRIRFTPQNVIYGQGTIGTSALFTLSRQAGFAQHVVPGDQLTGRYGHTMIMDTANDRLIVFGGYVQHKATNDVWAYDQGGYFQGWHKLSPTGTAPALRQYAAAVYDPVNQRMIMFGGWNGSAMGDLWSLSLTRGSESWAPLSPAGTPPAARYFHNLVYDGVRNRALLFAGSSGPHRNDVWALSLTLGSETWTQVLGAGVAPSVRYGAQAVVDAPRDRMVVYGGDTSSGAASSQVFALSLAPGSETWTPIAPATPFGVPAARFLAPHCYSPTRQAMVVASGYSGGHGFLSDTWLLDLNGVVTWNRVAQDPTSGLGRVDGAAAFDPVRDRVAMFGGLGSGGTVQNSLAFLATGAVPAWSIPASPSAAEETPIGRWGACMAFDTRKTPNGRVVLFGGGNTGTRYNDVWWIDPAASTPAWKRMAPTGTPPAPRMLATAVYDGTPGLERMIVFGGITVAGPVNDLWVLDLSVPGSETWTEWVASGSPSARSQNVMVLDRTSPIPRILIHGGYGAAGRLGDVWQLTLSPLTWSQLVPAAGPAPQARYGHGGSYDVAGNRLILFHGETASGRMSDVWALDLTTLSWADKTPLIGAAPAARFHSARAATSSGTTVYVHGGYSSAPQSDLWRLDVPSGPGLGVWTQLAPSSSAAPLARHAGSACLNPLGKLYSGFGIVPVTPAQSGSDIWSLDTFGLPPLWQRIGDGNSPRGLVAAASVLDVANNRMVLFGGILDGVLENRIWQLNLGSPVATWSEVVPVTPNRPAPRRSANMVYDPIGNRMLMYGGYLGSTYGSITNELWQLDLALGSEAWTKLMVGAGPPGLADCSIVYDPVTSSAIVFGGQLASGAPSNGLWRLSLAGPMVWSQSLASGAPSARLGHSAVYDALGGRMVVFGGYAGSISGLGDMYSYDVAANTWSVLAVGGPAPGQRWFHSAVYDPTPGSERMILFGGLSSMGLGDCWQLDLRSGFPATWSALLGTVARPQPRWAHASVFDTFNRRMVIAGGHVDWEIPAQNNGQGAAETWFYGR